ncbi:MAG: hypothetical protein D6722_16535 [Bacteroidetes bacterium]|nr:MAG: hypothetical protein D6722_16535 [Bacteroidota bacterium]
MSRLLWSWILGGLLLAGSLRAHSPQETYARLIWEADQLRMKIELPWAFRQAVFARFPELEQASSRAQLEDGFREYLAENIRVWQGKTRLQPTTIALGDGQHSHSLSVRLLFPVTAGALPDLEIENRLLFNLFDQAQNHHSWQLSQAGKGRFISTPQQARFAPWGQKEAASPSRRAARLGYSLLFVGLMVALAYWRPSQHSPNVSRW